MLDIPYEVQELLHRDSTVKNFRIHFPNGEREDITNEELNSESVSFTESLCSESNLKFGLCEASCLSFETIGVGNIKGCTIEAWLEVDISSLEEEILSEIAIYPPDLDYPVYQIPYGRFVVDSCRRQKDFTERQVVAYTEVYHAESGLNPIEVAKQQFGIPQNVPYTVDSCMFAASNIKNPDIASFGLSEKDPSWEIELETQTVTTIDDGSGWEFEYQVEYYRIQLDTEVTNYDDFESVYWPIFTVNQSAVDLYDECYRESGLPVDGRYQYPAQVYLERRTKISDDPTENEYEEVSRVPLDPAYAIYPGIGYYKDYSMRIEFTTEVTARYDGHTEFFGWMLYRDKERSLTRYNLNGGFNVSFPRKKSGKLYYADEGINYAALINSHLELLGMFGRSGRDGKYQLVTLGCLDGLLPAEDLYPADDLYPDDGWDEQAGKSTYSDLWYDEYEVQPFGRIIARYRNLDGEIVTCTYQFDPEKPNTYYLNDNLILQSGSYEEYEIREMLDETLIPNLPSAGYVPMELECVGLPYLEAGDRIEVETGEEEPLRTYILQRTLTGIQGLQDEIEVSGDEINAGEN